MQSFAEYFESGGDDETIEIKKMPSDHVDKYIKKIYSLGKRSGDGVFIKVNGVNVFVEMVSYSTEAYMSEISMPPEDQGSGVGHKAMKMIVDLADKFKVKISLFPQPIKQWPYGDSISKDKLVAFYKQHGFVTDRVSHMVRIPR